MMCNFMGQGCKSIALLKIKGAQCKKFAPLIKLHSNIYICFASLISRGQRVLYRTVIVCIVVCKTTLFMACFLGKTSPVARVGGRPCRSGCPSTSIKNWQIDRKKSR